MIINWIDLKCRNMNDYTMKYLKLDVLILADLFENLREMCLRNYEIDPCYTFSTPELTWLSGLKHTKVKLKYYKEKTKEIMDFFEKGIRGGVSTVLGNRYVKCNNKDINEAYNLYYKPEKYEFDKLVKHFNKEKLQTFLKLKSKITCSIMIVIHYIKQE